MKRTAVLHPFLFAIWPVMFIYSLNVEFIPFSQAWVSLLIVFGVAILLFLPLAAILRSLTKAGAVLSLFLVLFFSFSHVYVLLWKGVGGYSPSNESVALLIVWALLFAGGTALVLAVKNGWREITMILNGMALVLILMSVLNVGLHELRARTSGQQMPDNFEIEQVRPVDATSLPNIYYIILDSYAREDILREMYAYDNSEFYDFLEQRGFFIADRSLANYPQTDMSLASTLNLCYLDELARTLGPDSLDRRPMEDMVQNSSVVRFLKGQGYTIVALASGFSITDLKSSDVHISPARSWNELEVRLLCSTPIPWLAIRGTVFDPYEVHRQKVLYTLDQLPHTTQQTPPYFVFAHIMAPHGPFVFDEHGNAVQPEGQFDLRDGLIDAEEDQMGDVDLQGYTKQLTFVTNRIKTILDDLLSQSSRATVVILQGDHGSGPLPDEGDVQGSIRRLAILNAYLLPGESVQGPYAQITPVNTFRLVLNRYLGTDLGLLEDRSYLSSWEHPYKFRDVTGQVRSYADNYPSK